MIKDIVGYEGIYKIDESGNVFSIKKNKRLKLNNSADYLRIGLCKKGKQKHILVHRLVALAFIPNPENKPEVNHKDGNKKNNNVLNLEWVTMSENRQHAYSTGIQKSGIIGEKHWNRKLNIESINIIRFSYSSGNYTQEYLARAFNVSRITIQNIISMKRWKKATE